MFRIKYIWVYTILFCGYETFINIDLLLMGLRFYKILKSMKRLCFDYYVFVDLETLYFIFNYVHIMFGYYITYKKLYNSYIFKYFSLWRLLKLNL
ncbi:hypothetical protein PCK1_000754 [Pneumocystis canis]|nr:hypothetical protein PCK1_000754 [Pneumocystis canis]